MMEIIKKYHIFCKLFLKNYQNFRLKQHAATSKNLPPLPESTISATNSSEQTEESYDPDDFENILSV